ncbi:MAG TPA: head maturation protease, ClpP-related [Streptosporangiaceae bacterium]|nr:head maturation protease, ClpP-related [Streptosporangiaceae bacterium]
MSNVYPLKCRISNEDAGPARVDVYDDIGAGGWFSDGVSAGDFAAQLAAVKGPLEVHINSGGGDVFDGITIGNAIRGYTGRVTTVVDGLAASIASVIAQAGQERVVQPGSMLMIHDASGVCVGDAAEMASMVETLDKVSDNIASIYASRSGRPQDFWRGQMKAETWYTAEEAVSAGLADKVGEGAAALPANLDLAAFATVPGRIAARLRALPVAAANPHGPMTGTHSHSHPAYGSQGSDGSHEHGHSHDGDADHHHSHDDGSGEPDGAQASARRGPVLGLESMPLVDKAMPVHHTATADEPWDGPAAVAAMPNDDAVLRYCHAWEDSEAASTPHREGDGDADDQKSNYKFPHHRTKGGPANLAACRNGLARLSGASIPDGDRAGVKAHLQAHLDDGSGDGDGAEDHGSADLSGTGLEEIRAALRGATA